MISQRSDRMKCQRCIKGAEARWRVFTDAMEMKVCAPCAEEARRLGIEVAALDRETRSHPEPLVDRTRAKASKSYGIREECV